MPTPRSARIFLATLPLLALAACGEEASDQLTAADPTPTSPAQTLTATPQEPQEPQRQQIDVNFDGDSISPNGDRIKVDLDEGVILLVRSDRAGELHVHSEPEQVVAFSKGTTEIDLQFNTPGVVEVEDHDASKVLMTLQVQ